MTTRKSQPDTKKPAAASATAAKPKARKPANQQDSLNPRQVRFCDEYLIDLNGKHAAIRAGYAPASAEVHASRLLSDAKVQARITELMAKREKRTEVTQDMVLRRWWDIATADANELISYRRVCCRHCFGDDHAYQWKDAAEFERATQAAIKAAQEATIQTGEQHKPVLPTDEGGYGFDPTIKPHPKCPKCNGEGNGEVFAHDTRELSEQAKALYAGVKITKDGLEIKMQDQGKALENVARHLGMFNDKLTLKGDPENPIVALLGQIAGTSLPVKKETE